MRVDETGSPCSVGEELFGDIVGTGDLGSSSDRSDAAARIDQEGSVRDRGTVDGDDPWSAHAPRAVSRRDEDPAGRSRAEPAPEAARSSWRSRSGWPRRYRRG